MKSVLLTICLIIISGLVLYSTVSDWNMEKAFLIFFTYTLIITLITGLLLTVWYNGNFISNLKKSLRLSLNISLLSFLLGFLSLMVESLIR